MREYRHAKVFSKSYRDVYVWGQRLTFLCVFQHKFGADPRHYSIMSKEFLSDGNGRVSGVRTVRVEWQKDDNGRWQLKELPNTEHVS